MDHLCYLCIVFVMLSRLFIAALWSPCNILLSCPLGSWVSLWNFETIRGSLMTPKWQKLASLAQEKCTL